MNKPDLSSFLNSIYSAQGLLLGKYYHMTTAINKLNTSTFISRNQKVSSRGRA